MHVSLSFLLIGVGMKSLESGFIQLGAHHSYTSKMRNETLSVITSQIEALFIFLSIITQFISTFNISSDEAAKNLVIFGFWIAASGIILVPSWYLYKELKI